MNQGALKLREFVDSGWTQEEIAAELEVAQATVSRWLGGERRPTSKDRAQLEDVFGVGWRLWDLDAEAAA